MLRMKGKSRTACSRGVDFVQKGVSLRSRGVVLSVHLGEEGAVGGEVAIVPVGGQAVGTPVATFQNQFRRGFETVSGMTFPTE